MHSLPPFPGPQGVHAAVQCIVDCVGCRVWGSTSRAHGFFFPRTGKASGPWFQTWVRLVCSARRRPAQWWDTASPYHYVRTVLEGEHPSHGDILLVGGEDHPAGALSPVQYPAAYLRLEKWARERWPAAQEVVYKWTGQVRRWTAAGAPWASAWGGA